MKRLSALLLIAAGAFVSPAFAGNTAFDTSVTWDTDGMDYWDVSAFSPAGAAVVPGTGSANQNPTLSLEIGKRYKFSAPFSCCHVFSFDAVGAASPLLLRQFSGVGTFESNPSVDWFDDNTANMYFTFSPALADALFATGVTPKYICEIHGMMSGPVAIKAATTSLVWPSGGENFEDAVVGTTVPSAFSGWSITNGNANYTSVISQSPVGHPGQAAGSTRWLTINDTDGAGANRTYSPGIVLGTGTAGSYTFSAKVDIQSMAAGVPNLIVGQNNASPYTNTAGVEFTDTGVNLIIVGTTDGGVGKAGASVRQLLYNYTDAGGFGQNNWVTMGFTVNYDTGVLSGTATASNGTTVVNQTLSGIALQGTALKNDFRFCIRNNAAGATSVISYDNVLFTGALSTTDVKEWKVYGAGSG